MVHIKHPSDERVKALWTSFADFLKFFYFFKKFLLTYKIYKQFD